jgi:7-keto-8-aminopelargonate synthetase-like enzyme
MVILKSSVSNFINLDDKTYSYFGGNNYLGLANHPTVIQEAIKATIKYGVNFSASRQTTGTSELHLELEKLLSEFNQKEASVVFASGYMGNRILLHALRDRYSAIFYDELSHPSIIDGFPADVTSLFKYNHCDCDHLELLLKEHYKLPPLIITDGVFPLTGEIAPLDRIQLLAEQYNAIVIVDEAHSAGVLGENGRGTPEYFNLEKKVNIFQSGTMSKAIGVYGGFISDGSDLIDTIRKKSSLYIASTALPPPIVSAGCAAVRILQQQPQLRVQLIKNAGIIKNGIKEMDFMTTSDPTQIIPLFFKHERNAIELSVYLRENNIIVPYVKYPLKMDKFIVRITASAIHTQEQIKDLLAVLKKWRDRHGIDKD